MASQETAGPSCQRFGAKTPKEIAGDAGSTIHVAYPPRVVMQNIDLGGGLVETNAPKFKVCKGKGTTTVTLDFDHFDDDVFDEEAKNARASRLTESTIDMNTGEKVACQLEKGVSIGNFACYYCFVWFEFYVSVLILDFVSFCCRGIFS